MELEEFQTSSGCRIFQLPMQVFPGMNGYAYFTAVDGMRVLIDAGSGLLTSSDDLEAGLKEAGVRLTGSPYSFEDLTHILITHAHIDHIGGLTQVRPRTKALLGVHELDQRIISHYEERVSVIARRLRNYLTEAGISGESRDGILEMYRINKALFHSMPVDFTYEAIGMHLGPFEFLHVPGHCAGHVAIRLEDIIFSGDHVLMDTSPHQSPEHLTLSTGLDHYLHSLDAFETWAATATLALGGHKRPITDIPGRCEEIRQVHRDRLNKVMEVLSEPHTVADVSRQLFKTVDGYNILLAIEEAGAHVEYLYQRGTIEIANYEELESGVGTAILYKVSS